MRERRPGCPLPDHPHRPNINTYLQALDRSRHPASTHASATVRDVAPAPRGGALAELDTVVQRHAAVLTRISGNDFEHGGVLVALGTRFTGYAICHWTCGCPC